MRIHDPIARTSLTLEAGGEYQTIAIGNHSDDMSITFSYPDGYYSARLYALSDSDATHAGITLIAPLASLDRSRPVLDLDRVRIPVYQEKKYLLRDLISETSQYAFSIDPDTTVDTSGNGIYEDDYTESGT